MFDALLRLGHRVERVITVPVLAGLATMLFVSGIVGYLAAAGSSSDELKLPQAAPPTTAATTSTVAAAIRTPIAGYRTAEFTITPQGQPAQSHCGLLADSEDLRSRGLMYQHDLAGYDGMLFIFPQDSTALFYMANVPVALSVAFFDGAGHFVSASDMEPCTVAAPKCPRYGAEAPYRYAMETLKGGLGGLHVGHGSSLAIGPGGSCV